MNVKINGVLDLVKLNIVVYVNNFGNKLVVYGDNYGNKLRGCG